MQSLAVVCAIEAAIVAVLAVQVFGARSAPSDAQPQAPVAASPENDAATAATAAATPPGAPAAPSHTNEPTRTEAAAKFVRGDAIGVLLTGSLRMRDGKPAAAWLQATLDRATRWASAAEDGSYAMLGLGPGEWKIDVGGQTVVAQSTSLTITDDAVQHRDFVLDPSFPVKVLIVTPDGGDATMALRKSWFGMRDFAVAGQRDRLPERLAPTDYGLAFVGDAKWDAERNPNDGFAGTLHFASLPGHAALLQRHLVLEQQLVQPGQQEVKFVVDTEAIKKLAGSATVRVLDAASGEPLTTARVSLHTSNGGGGGPPVDAQGRAELTGLAPGLLVFEINGAPDHENLYSIVKVDPGQRLDLGEVRLGAHVKLQGTALDADGKPADATLTWTELKWRTTPTAFRTNRISRTGADGSFALWGTGAGAIAVTAFDKDGNVARGVFDNPPSVPIVLRLARACECTITRPTDPTRSFTVTLFDDLRRAIASAEIEPRTSRYPLHMPAGRYTFEVHDEQSRLVKTGTLEFGATTCSLEIR